MAATPPASVAVIGAGIAGLVCAGALTGHGLAVTVFDKGRAPGGRISTRREGGVAFDHGAQFFAARDPAFRSALSGWSAAGVAVRWEGRVVELDGPGLVVDTQAEERWVPAPSSSALARYLADGLRLELGNRVVAVERRHDGWYLARENEGWAGPFAIVLSTVPMPQAVPLLSSALPALAEQLARVRIQPCWAVCVAPPERLPIDWDAAFVGSGSLAWICRNSAKPGRDPAEAWVLHGSAGWSAEHLEAEPAAVVGALAQAFGEITGCALDPEWPAIAHRWRFARTGRPLGQPCLFDAETGIGLAGDWCVGARIEAAFLSGSALAGRVLGIEGVAATVPAPAGVREAQ